MKLEDAISTLKDIQNEAQNLKNNLISFSIDRESKVCDAEWFCDYLDLEIDKLIQSIEKDSDTNLHIPEGKERCNMRKSVEDLMNDSREEGREEVYKALREMSPEELKEFLLEKGIEIDDTPDFTQSKKY